MSSDIPKINELPLSQDFIPGDKIIIGREEEGYLIDFDNLFVTTDQISFQQDIRNDIKQVTDLDQYSKDKFDELVGVLTEKSIGRSTAHLIDVTTSSSQGSLSSSSYREFITSTDSPLIGPNNLILFDNALVDKLDLSIDETTTTEGAECDVDRIVYGAGTISIPKGTYRLRASVSLSPDVNFDLDQSTIDEYIRKKQRIWAYLSFVQLTSPERVIINGAGASTFNTIGQSVTLNLNGYFYTEKTRQYGLKVHTLGKFYPGVVTGTYAIDNNNSSVDTKLLSISDLFGREQYNQSRLIIERISETNTLQPKEDSPEGFRSQALILQSRVPLLYNAGWLQRINVADTSVVPSVANTTITNLPFTFSNALTSYIGDLRGYITEPKSYQGYIKIGDTAKFRSQRPNNRGILAPIFAKYDARDPEMKQLAPGWYGLIVDERTKRIGDRFDTIFRVDANGVVSQRQYITDPLEYFQRCIAGNTPPPTTNRPPTTTATATTPPPSIAFRAFQRTGAEGAQSITVPAGVTFIHAVCIGGGQGGIGSRYIANNATYIPNQGGQGGNLVYMNNIPVVPGDTIILSPGTGGRGQTAGKTNNANKGGTSVIRRVRNGVSTVIMQAAGGGQTQAATSGIIRYGGYGDFGNIQLVLSIFVGRPAILREHAGGGGGAGGYGGNGGKGGRSPGGTVNRAGGNGGGAIGLRAGGGGSTAINRTGGNGGGVGARGANNSQTGLGGRAPAANAAANNGGPGAGGSGVTFGGGGAGNVLPTSRKTQRDLKNNEESVGTNGGNGVVRIIWGTGKSYPRNAT